MHSNAVSILALAIASLPCAVPAAAQSPEGQSSGQRVEPAGDDFHDTIVVSAAGLKRLDLLAGTSVLDGIELQREASGQVGEVLARLPGVTASGFAPGASRPILRGFGGERVRVLTDGIGAIDASGMSDDHAVSVEPLIAERIEVLRGPAVMLYGSQAIGGAVNVITRRIPPGIPDEAVHVDFMAGIDTAAEQREGGLSLDVPFGASVAFHVDGSWRNAGDLAVPGYVASAGLRQQLLEAADDEAAEGHAGEAEELREGADTRGVLPNSWADSWTLGTGLAFFSGESDLGLSFDYYDTGYGIPGLPGVGHAHGEGEEAGDVSIGMKRYRADLRGTLDLGQGFFDEVRTRWGYSDYTHTEFEGGEVGTVFDVKGVEGRVELVQSPRDGWHGSFGAQYSHVDFAALGEEAFIPGNATGRVALFAVQELAFEPFELELGGRYEQTRVNAGATLGIARKFATVSGAAGLSVGLLDEMRAGVNLSRAERAPSAQELFAEGPHAATRQYEIGDSMLGKEGSWGIEAYLGGQIGSAEFSASIYRNWFDSFIFLSANGQVEDGLEVFEFLQQNARQFGIEGEIAAPVHETDGFTLLAELRGDYTRATLADGSPVPRIPPVSLAGALEGRFDHFDARGEVQWSARQDRVSVHETPTGGFTTVNLSLAWHPLEGDDNFTLMAQVANLFDAEGRRHSSFTKEFVPLAGRNFKLSLRASL